MPHRYPAEIEVDEAGRHVVSFLDVPFCHDDGATEAEALVEAKGALLVGLRFFIDDGKLLPEPSAMKPGELFVEVSDEEIAAIRAMRPRPRASG